MTYVPHTEADRRAMLEAIGVASIDELFAMVPASVRLSRRLDLPPALTELELSDHLAALARRNVSTGESACFLGGGSYDHFVPAVVDAIAARGEFYTSYTPYQPEASQGNLQVFFEYQTLVTQLTGMDVSNASLYDGGSATAEAALMCLAASGRRRIVTSAALHPEYRQILATYLANLDIELTVLGVAQGATPLDELQQALGPDVAAVIVQQPNFLGCLEEAERLVAAAHQAGALAIVVADPVSLGVLKRPGDYGADIVVAEGQSLGSPLAFGGPYLGILACRERLMRRMPGRITGQTVDRHGRRAFVLTLQTREQHIRREKATSNICTNQGLLALRATVFLAVLGPAGLREMAELCLRKAHYAAELVARSGHLRPAFPRPFFKEFVVRDVRGRVERRLEEARRRGILAGVPLAPWYPEWEDCFLVAVTEKRTRAQIDAWAETLSAAGSQAELAHA